MASRKKQRRKLMQNNRFSSLGKATFDKRKKQLIPHGKRTPP